MRGGLGVARGCTDVYFRDVRLAPELVLPALRGTYGREYHHADIAPTTQQMLPESAVHGAVALAEHQTAGRGRLGRVWHDEAGTGLTFSVALYPPPPVFAWPELTLVAAAAVAAAVGDGATIKHPNDVLSEGRKVAGILAEAGDAGGARHRRSTSAARRGRTPARSIATGSSCSSTSSSGSSAATTAGPRRSRTRSRRTLKRP